MWENNEVLTALLRVGLTNQAGAERMQGILRDQLLPVARHVCPDPEQVPARAALMTSQLLRLALTRYVLRMPSAVRLTRTEITTVAHLASRTYYDRHRALGKTHTQAPLRLTRRHINVLFAMLRHGAFYEPRVPRATAA
jgi:hypothetical protein